MIRATIDQLLIFVTIAEYGSLAAAARVLHKAPSAVTFSIQSLEDLLGVTLIDRSGYRAVLSQEARELLPRAERLLRDLALLQQKARSLSAGLETEIGFCIDSMYPVERIAGALQRFAEKYPGVNLNIMVSTSARAEKMIRSGEAAAGLLVDFTSAVEDVLLVPVESVRLVAVCAAHHPLAQKSGLLSADDVRDQRQIVLSDGEREFEEWGHRGVASLDLWRVTSLQTKKSLLLAGLGWGSLPLHMAEQEISDGRLYRLGLAEWGIRSGSPELPAVLARKKDNIPGAATQCLLEQITGLQVTIP